MASFSTELRVARVYRKALKDTRSNIERAVLLVLLDNQRQRILPLAPRQILDKDAVLWSFLNDTAFHEEAATARSLLSNISSTGSPQDKSAASLLLQKHESQANWKRRIGQGYFDEWKSLPGGAIDSSRTRH